MKRKPDPDLREFRRLIRDSGGLMYEINRIVEAHVKTELPRDVLPQEFSPVLCISCNTPSILVRDLKARCYLVCCLHCRQMSQLDTIEEGNDPFRF